MSGRRLLKGQRVWIRDDDEQRRILAASTFGTFGANVLATNRQDHEDTIAARFDPNCLVDVLSPPKRALGRSRSGRVRASTSRRGQGLGLALVGLGSKSLPPSLRSLVFVALGQTTDWQGLVEVGPPTNARGGARLQQLAVAVAPNIRVNAIWCPAPVQDRHVGVRLKARVGVPASARPVLHRAPRLTEVFEASVFLSSPDAGFITGQTLLVDGGVHLFWSLGE